MPAITIVGVPESIERELRARLAGNQLAVVIVGCGEQPTGPFLEISQETWQSTIAALRSAFRAAQAAAAELVGGGHPGRVVMLVPRAQTPAKSQGTDPRIVGYLMPSCSMYVPNFVGS